MTEDRRHQMEEKTYAIFTADSIKAAAESIGLSSLPDDAAAALGEDASYRVRQVVMLATEYMRHAKRRRLGVDDFNRAAKDLGLVPVHGHGTQEPTAFRHVKDSDVHVVDDAEVNLCDVALSSYIPKQIGQPSIKAHWLAVEGIIKISSMGSSSQGKSSKDMSSPHLKYYNSMTKALLSISAESKKKALQDLKTNPNLVPVLPYIINFVVSGIKNMSHDISHLTTMLNTIRALLHNRSLYLMHKPYLSTIVQGVEFCVLEPLAASINSANDHWVLRDYAAKLLAEIVNRWSSPVNHLRYNTIKCLRDVLHDLSKPFYSHYGAVMTLVALGHKAIEDVILPQLANYWPHLCNAMEDTSPENLVAKSDSHKMYGALRLAAEKVMRKEIRKFEEQTAAQLERERLAELLDVNDNLAEMTDGGDSSHKAFGGSQEKGINVLYSELYEYFGDSLVTCLPLPATHNVFKPVKKEETVSLGDQNSGKSGEELLDNLMEQIHLQEKLDQERKEQELQEQKERERQERKRLAREAQERKRKEEEERQRRLRREEEEQRRKQREKAEEERQKRLKEEEERRQRDWEEQIRELNKNRTRPQWQQEIEVRRKELEEEMQYSRMMEAKKRQMNREENERQKRMKEEEDKKLLLSSEDEDQGGRSLRRRKPVNYTEKDDDISDLFDDNSLKVKPAAPRPFPALPPHSDISDDSEDERRKLAGQSPGTLEALSIIDASKGSLKLKIKRQSTHSGTPPHPLSGTPQYPGAHHSPSMMSPMHPSPLSGPLSTPPPPPVGSHHRSKSSSGSEKESKHKKGKHSRSGSSSMAVQDISDPEEPLYDRPQGSVPPLLYSPGGESSGSDSNPNRKAALKLKLRLTPKESGSE